MKERKREEWEERGDERRREKGERDGRTRER